MSLKKNVIQFIVFIKIQSNIKVIDLPPSSCYLLQLGHRFPRHAQRVAEKADKDL